jgi:hypothetical protein
LVNPASLKFFVESQVSFEISFKDFLLPKPNSFSTGFQQAISCLDHPQVMAIFGNKFSNQVPMHT